ncbi:MAG: lipopolysaccharide biosynthesis protein [Patescibacteria group bacterium]
MGYTKDVVRGVSWISILRILTRIITFVRLAVLGRLLTPVQFGFFGIASLLLSLLEILTETGINVFLIQHKGKIKEYINSAWAISILRGIILGSVIFLLAKPIASFFEAPGVYNIITLMSVVPFVRGFINPAIVSFQKELLFRKEFQLRFVIFFIDCLVSIVVGFVTKSAISFIYGLIASALLEVVLSYILIPVWPKLKFEYLKIKYVMSRGWWVTLTGIFSYISDNGDNIIIGKIIDTSALGIYQVAYKFSTLPISEIADVVSKVIFPVYVKFSNDKSRLLSAFLKVLVTTSIAACVLGLFIFIFAKEIILLFMGSQWIQAVPVVQVLIFYGIIRTILGNFTSVFLSVGRQDYVARMTFFRVIGLTITIVPLVIFFGLVGAGYSVLISVFFEIPVVIYFSYKVFKIAKE